MTNLLWLPLDDTPLVVAAEIYAAHGWAVFPCRKKRPVTSRGLYDASCDVAQVRAWWAEHARANLGLRLPARWFALDVDRRHNGFDSLRTLERQHEALPFTLRATTGGGGEHWIFTLPDGITLTNRAGVVPGIDVRAQGGYLIVAPSVHPESKRRYRWHTVIAPEPAPAWLLEVTERRPPQPPPQAVTPPQQPAPSTRAQAWAQAALARIAHAIATAPEGHRNETLNRGAYRVGQFVGGGLIDEQAALATLRAAGLACGLPEREVDWVLR